MKVKAKYAIDEFDIFGNNWYHAGRVINVSIKICLSRCHVTCTSPSRDIIMWPGLSTGNIAMLPGVPDPRELWCWGCATTASFFGATYYRIFGFIDSQYGRREWISINMAYTWEFSFETISPGTCIDAELGGWVVAVSSSIQGMLLCRNLNSGCALCFEYLVLA